MSKLKKVLPGQPLKISATTYNLFVDAANDYLQRRLRLGGGASGFQRPAGIISVKNNSGFDQSRFAVLGLDEPIYSPTDNEIEFKNNPSMKAVAPTLSHYGRFVVLQEPLAIGVIGRGMVTGITPMRIEWIAPNLVGSELWSDANWALVAVGGGTTGGDTMLDKHMAYVVPGDAVWGTGIAITNKLSEPVQVLFTLWDCQGAMFTCVYPFGNPPASGYLYANQSWSTWMNSMLPDFSGTPAVGQGRLEITVTSSGHTSADIATFFFATDGIFGCYAPYGQTGP